VQWVRWDRGSIRNGGGSEDGTADEGRIFCYIVYYGFRIFHVVILAVVSGISAGVFGASIPDEFTPVFSLLASVTAKIRGVITTLSHGINETIQHS
jgi:hypothetical protein